MIRILQTGLWALTFLMLQTVQAAEITELTGEVHLGQLVRLNAQTAVLDQQGTILEIPVGDLLQVVWQEHGDATAKALQWMTLAEGSEFYGQLTECDGLQVGINSPALGAFALPLMQVKALRFSAVDKTTAEQWQNLLKKEVSEDMLVIRKGEILDFLPGVVTEFDEKEVQFLYQGSEIPVKREKVFGIIYPRAKVRAEGDFCRVSTSNGDQFGVEKLTLAEGKVQVSLDATQTVSLSLDQVEKLDFSQGRIVLLSDLNPEVVEHTPYFDTVWNFQRDKTNIGEPLQLGGKRFTKGLWIHSKTLLTYRLAGEYSRFQAVMGIDDAVAENGLGHVVVKITGDERVLYEGEVAATGEPLPLDLNVTGVRFLTVSVDFGNGLDIGDHLVLGDPKLIK